MALSRAKLKEWLAADLSTIDLLVIQIDRLRVGDHVLVAAIGIDGAGDKHVLDVALGATENAAVVKALLADLIERGLRPDIARLFIVDGAEALSRAVRDTFGDFALIQRCQVHRDAISSSGSTHRYMPGIKKVLRQAWDSPTAEQAERVLRNLARRLDHDAPGVSASILEGLDEMLTVIRIGLPDQLRALPWLHQCDRESDGHAADGLPQRQTLARRTHGAAMDWNRNAGGRDKLPPFEGPQATPDFEGRVAAPSTNAAG